jgi:Siphovirus ReqiPepy6 Gp37-like protein
MMEAFTLTKSFLADTPIDVFDSLIWTERYYGDSDIQFTLPAIPQIVDKLIPGTFVGIRDSKEVMILETQNIKDNTLNVTGISLLKWLNNRFIRYTAAHEDKQFNIEGLPAGQVMWKIVDDMCVTGGPVGVSDPSNFLIPGLKLKAYDTSGSPITVAVSYGPVYNALLSIGTTYQIGMSLTLESADSSSYSLAFLSYKGIDRTSDQTDRPIVRFSPHMDSLTNIEELQSIANYATRAMVWVPPNPDELATVPGTASVSNPETPATGFDMRAVMVFADDITTDMVGGSLQGMTDTLNQRAKEALEDHNYIRHVDGEIVPASQFQYGRDYFLGDVVEVQGYGNIVQKARITEYIRSQDSAGEKAYPTVTMIEE